ncbi:MAG: sulfite exporter TauE/SafE family protein [Actinomycetota bacterium]
MTPAQILFAVGIGLASGMLSGMFGVGGGIVMTPGLQTFLATSPIAALATPLPVIFPTAIAGALRYRAAGELDMRAVRWLVVAGVPAAVAGAAVTEVVPTPLLLLVTAALLAWQAIGILRGGDTSGRGPDAATAGTRSLVLTGAAAGFVSGLLGIGGGLIMVPLLAGWLGMPLKRALGTSLAAIVGMVVPGTIVHAALGNVAWDIVLALVLGAVPGARIGSMLALRAGERTLRILVGGFMAAVALVYGTQQVRDLTLG